MKLKYLFWTLLVSSFSFCACDVLLEDEDGESGDDTEEKGDNNNNNDGGTSVSSDKEVNRAFNYINEIRSNPSKYSSAMGVSLSGVEAKPALNWNKKLAKVAQAKAQDMVDRKYFSHTDPDGYGVNYFINEAGYELNSSWYKSKSLNYFESIAAGYATGDETVKQLVYDSGMSDDDAGHRSHLLGISDWNASLYDIGIGHAYGANTNYKHYWSFIIAKHDY